MVFELIMDSKLILVQTQIIEMISLVRIDPDFNVTFIISQKRFQMGIKLWKMSTVE